VSAVVLSPVERRAVHTPGGSAGTPATAELLDRAAGYAGAARATSTRAAYRSDWTHFTTWAASAGREALPASEQTLCAYLAKFAGGLSGATLSRRRSTIALVHRAAGLTDPVAKVAARECWAAIRRAHRVAPRPKSALWTADVARLVGQLPTDHAARASRLGRRDRALLLLGFAAALRRSELAALDIDDVTNDPHGLVVRVVSSKTDQTGGGATIGVPFGQQSALCPVTALHGWREALAGALNLSPPELSGPLFRPITRHGRLGVPGRAGSEARLSPAAVRLVVRRRCEAAGLDPEIYAAHSLRSGFATQASANGANERDVMRYGRWQSVAVARSYDVQRGNLFTDNVAGQLGL